MTLRISLYEIHIVGIRLHVALSRKANYVDKGASILQYDFPMLHTSNMCIYFRISVRILIICSKNINISEKN
jgi:hypothetical protein